MYPRAATAPAEAGALFELAERALGAATAREADAANATVRETMIAWLSTGSGTLAAALAAAPSAAVARHLARELDAAWVAALPVRGRGPRGHAVRLAHRRRRRGRSRAADPRDVPGTLPAADALAAILREHGALAGNRSFALANVLVAADALDVAQLPALHAWRTLRDATEPGAVVPPRALAPAPIAVASAREAVHLRFLVGSALARRGADLLATAGVRGWGMPFTRELARQLHQDGVSVLAIPRAPARPVPAVRIGRVAQREVGAQVFVGNALRRIRAAVGEPVATISAHRASDAACGGELRLSLSSPLDAREAEGFRCPLYPDDAPRRGRVDARRPAARLPGDRHAGDPGRARRTAIPRRDCRCCSSPRDRCRRRPRRCSERMRWRRGVRRWRCAAPVSLRAASRARRR